jgi:hypothetical protein
MSGKITRLMQAGLVDGQGVSGKAWRDHHCDQLSKSSQQFPLRQERGFAQVGFATSSRFRTLQPKGEVARTL